MKMEVGSMIAPSALALLLVLCSLQTAVAVGNQGLGQKCTFDTECETEHAYCDAAGTGCECKAGYIKSLNKSKCLSVEGIYDLGAKCEEDVQCGFTESASTCKGGQCRACSDTSVKCDDPTGCALHDVDGKCWKSKKLGESCSSDEECWTVPGASTSRKCETTCICAQDSETDKCKQMSKTENANSDNGASTLAKTAFWATLVAVFGLVAASPYGGLLF